ncbi:MAG: MBL fold metallo-hydrolase [Acidobacteriaceae bacterium]|nr:MBL fold metallo-hydrolase [Acidobacteriaceae bacterium]
MKVTQISAYGFQLTKFGLVNSYLVRESDDWTLIDTNLGGSENDILQAARSVGAKSIARILLTHAHVDHVGSTDQLILKLGAVHLAVGRREARMLPKPPDQDLSLDPDEPQCPMKGGFPGIESSPTHFLSGGELYGSLRCVATPGHTTGHMSYLDERDGTLYAGDAIGTLRGRTTVSGWAPWWFPVRATWHRPTALESVKALAELPVKTLAAGHGRLVENGAEGLREAVRAAEAKPVGGC